MDQQVVSKVFKALSDPMRLDILSHFQKNMLVPCGEIQADCPRSQPTVSHHLRTLVESGILLEQKSGTQKSFSVNTELFERIGLNFTHLIKNVSTPNEPRNGTTNP